MKNIGDLYELSHMQLGMLLDNIYAKDSGGYHQQMIFEMKGTLEEKLFKQAWFNLINAHEVLRTSFHWEDLDKPLQVVHRNVDFFWDQKDLSGLESQLPAKALEELIESDIKRPFIVNQAPLLRCYLMRMGREHYFFMLSYHHLLLDGWSLPIILRDVFMNYQALCSGENRIIETSRPYKDFIHWLQNTNHEAAKEFWKNKLDGFFESNRLVSGDRNYDPKNYSPQEYELILSAEESQAIIQHAKELRVTPYIFFQGFCALLMSEFTADKDIVIGATVSGRPADLADSGSMVGLFMNTIPIRIIVDTNEPVKDFLGRLFEDSRQTDNFSYASLADIRKWSQLAPGEPLFETAVVYENYPFGHFTESLPGLTISNFKLIEKPNIPLAVIVIPGHEFRIKFLYNASYIHRRLVESLSTSLRTALLDFNDNKNRLIRDLKWFSDQEDSVIVSPFQQKKPVSSDTNIWTRFNEQVKKTPENIFIREGSKEFTFNEVENLSASLACELEKHGLSHGSVVSLYMSNSWEAIVTILSLLKLGVVYVPLDHETPVSRIEFIVNDCKAEMILCNDLLAHNINGHHFDNTKIVSVAQLISAMQPGNENPGSNVIAEDLAYIIYTSGSTGVPKGVQISHANLLNYVDWSADYYGKATFPFYSSLAFDLTVTSIYTPMFTGDTIIVYKGNDRSLIVQEIISDDQVDIIKLTPSHLKIIRTMGKLKSRIKKMIVGGENLERQLADAVIHNFNNDLVIYNEYGPTEATVGCFVFEYDGKGITGKNIPIGVPIVNTEGFILNENLYPVPYGAKGELYLSGLGISKGYIGRADHTRFKDNTIGRTYKNFYRTGDIVRQTAQDHFEFLGRADDQIKFHGHRLELGDIEIALESHPQIRSAGVTVVVPERTQLTPTETYYCTRCGIESTHPNIVFNAYGLCNMCIAYEAFKDKALEYFRSIDELQEIFRQHTSKGEYDCLMLLSGGKDSTYALYRLVKELQLKVLVFTLDNGFISEKAKDNMRDVCSRLGVELIIAGADSMNEIFNDSLKRFNNVCQGCFKTIYTLSLQLALKKKIPYIVTGLSRGQLFETRLHELYNAGIFDPDKIDEWVLEARKEYHRKSDAVSKTLGIEMFKDDSIFQEVQFIDFYRYCDVSLTDMYKALKSDLDWRRPEDTGRSTNCLINALGIYVHKKERGYHNYSLPYSWDVRLGHKQRDQALEELDDNIDAAAVKDIAEKIGYQLNQEHAGEPQLLAFYTSDQEIASHELRSWMKQYSSNATIPTFFIRTGELPLTINGKIDRKRLVNLGKKSLTSRTAYVAPGSLLENQIIEVWKEVLGIDPIGILDNIFDIGGHSMAMTLIYNKLKEKIGLSMSLAEMYEYPTVAALAAKLEGNGQEEYHTTDRQTTGRERINAMGIKRRTAISELPEI